MFRFLKQTVVTGFFVLLPLGVMAIVLQKVVDLTKRVAAPVLKFLPHELVTHFSFPALFAITVVLFVCFAVGILARLALLRAAGQWLERSFLEKLSIYRAVRNLLRGFSDSSDANAFKAALLNSPKDSAFVYLVEDHGNGLATVMIPSSPTPMAGSVKIVRRENVQLLDVKMSAVARVMTQWGVGTRELLRHENISNDEDTISAR